jgi:aryl-phospho-beta-D-glucosidase BglC (GH1 family)
MQRRSFIRNTGFAAAAIGLNFQQAISSVSIPSKNKLPKWKGFNLTDFFNPDPSRSRDNTTEDHFRWMQDWGFDFVRLPIAYPWYLNIDRTRNITPEETYKIDEKQVEKIDRLITMAHKYNQHVSINLHRAPGYCVNAGFVEPFNLWRDQAAQDAFYYHWSMWAKRYKNTSSKKISFDLLNEPSHREDMNDQHSKHSPVPGEIYRKVAKAAAKR